MRRPMTTLSRNNTWFAIFCMIVFSKIAWYDLRVYLPEGDRRALLTGWYTAWILAQFLFCAVLARPLFRQARRRSRILAFWTLAVLPYFVIGAVHGRFGTFFLGDLARYALPMGFLLYFCLALQTLDLRRLMYTVVASMAFYVALRFAIHLYLAPAGVMRYGVAWEVYLMIFLVAAAAMLRGWYLVATSAAVVALATVFTLGLSRSTLMGSCAGGALVILLTLSTRHQGAKRPVACMASVAIAATLLPMIVPPAPRLNLGAVVSDSNIGLLDNDVQSPGEDVPSDLGPDDARPASLQVEAAVRPEPVRPDPVRPDSVRPDPVRSESVRTDPVRLDPVRFRKLPSGLDLAKDRWEASVDRGSRSMDSRITEAAYFLEQVRRTPGNFLLGTGAGWSVALALRTGTRIVRGAHNTYVTLAFRHGIIIGIALIAFLAFYGLPKNLRQLRNSQSAESSAFLTSLIAYRITAALMAIFHQGFFDDPLVFLSIGIAVSLPDTIPEEPGPALSGGTSLSKPCP